jgi:hypothetical protein
MNRHLLKVILTVILFWVQYWYYVWEEKKKISLFYNMRIIFKYADQSNEPICLNLEVSLEIMVKDLRIKISRVLDLPLPSFQVVTKNCGQSVLLTDTWPLSFFVDSADAKLKLKLLEFSGYSRKDSVISSSGSSFLGPMRLSCFARPFDQAVLYCKANSVEGLLNLLAADENNDEDWLNYTEENMWGLIHYACYMGAAEVVRFLVARSANCNKVTIDEWTALQLACFFGHVQCVRELVRYPNLQINKKTRFRGTALHIACEGGNLEMVEELLKNRPVLSIEDNRQKTPIELAKSGEVLEVLAVYAGQCELQKCVDDGSDAPFCGEVFYVNVFGLMDKPVFLYMDIVKGVISRYQKKEQFLDRHRPQQIVRIIDVQAVNIDLSHKDQYYFSLDTAKGTLRFFTKFQELTIEWVERINKASEYCMIHSQDTIFQQIQDTVEVSETDSTADSSGNLAANETETVDFSSFTIIEEIGKGSFGIVYKVSRISTGLIYAMKSLSKSSLQKQKQLKYAISECKIMKQLNHPFIVPLYYAFQTPKYLYLILELCPNGDLYSLIEKYGKLTESVAKFYLAEVILALEYLHELGIIYRDLKPANVLIGEDFHAKLADFGLAKEKVNKINPAMTMAGTPAYLPPEIVAKKGATAEADIYGLGPLFYELLTGETPYYHEDIDTLFNNITKSKLSFPSYISGQAKDFITAVMNKDPGKRPQISQIKRHQLFRKMDWAALIAKKIRPPLKA